MSKSYLLHLQRPEHDLLKRHGKLALISGMTLRDLLAAMDTVRSIVNPNADGQADAAILYLIGVQQGIHNERQRRANHD